MADAKNTKKAKYGSIVFKEKIEFFENKLRLPTATYADVFQMQHAKAFVIAGAMQDDILKDFQTAVAKGISGESTLADFQKDFDSIVNKHGWSYNGKRNWRSKVIYDTNIRMAHSAGRYKQMQAVKRTRPFWQYQHSIASENARDQHLAWHGLVLHADDSWWDTHYPINGYGCQCFVKTLSQREMDRKGLKVAKSPKIDWETKQVNVRTNPRSVKVPKGISPGFDYNAGKASWGQILQQKHYDDARANLKNQKLWQAINLTTWAENNRPEQIPLKPFKLPDNINLASSKKQLLIDLMGAETKIFNLAGLPVMIDAAFLTEHLKDYRKPYLPLLIETLNNPYEMWQSFEVHKINGQVALRRRLISAYQYDSKAIYVVLNVEKGVLVGWTMVPVKPKQLNKERVGELILKQK